MCDVPKSEAVSVECSLKPRSSIDEEFGILHVVFLSEFLEEFLGHDRCSGWKQPDVEVSVRLGIDGSLQPPSLVIQLNHGLVDRYVIRAIPMLRL